MHTGLSPPDSSQPTSFQVTSTSSEAQPLALVRSRAPFRATDVPAMPGVPRDRGSPYNRRLSRSTPPQSTSSEGGSAPAGPQLVQNNLYVQQNVQVQMDENVAVQVNVLELQQRAHLYQQEIQMQAVQAHQQLNLAAQQQEIQV